MTTSVEPEGQTGTSDIEAAISRCLPQHAVDTATVPYRMHDGIHIPFARYVDPAFAELENTKMWTHTWQWAAREEDIPLPGDFIEYTIVDRTVVIVRQPDNSIKVLENVCPHRATQLVEPMSCGTFGGNQIVCPFHGWRWNVDGSQSYIYGRQGFEPDSIDPAKVGLKEVRSAIKYGFIWVNLDDDAPDIEEFFGTYDTHLAPVAMDRMRVRWWKQAVVPANWKVAIEAFMEAYHIMQAHPELALGYTGDAYSPDLLQFFHHGMGHVDTTPPFDPNNPSFAITESPIEGMNFGRYFLEQNRVLYEGTDGSSTARDEFIADRIRDLPDDQLFFKFFEELYTYAGEANIPLPPLDPNMANYGFIFPNMVFLGIPGNVLFYRVRPNGHDPNSSTFEALGMQIPRASDLGAAAPRPEGPLQTEEWPFVLRQDIENISRQQRGYRSGRTREATMSPRYEPMISTLHNEIDRYIATY